MISPFRIEIPDPVLDDLRTRLRRTRFTGRSGERPWQAGTDPDYLRDLVGHWADGYDWRAREAALNAYPQFLTEIDGRRLHFLRIPGRRPSGAPVPPPLLLNHGWPSSFVELLPLADRLTDPGRYGGDPATAFDVVVPSMPGFLYSELPAEPLTRSAMAGILHRLMTEVLGHHRYGVFGGDIGGAVAGWLGATYPDQVVGVHLIHPPFPASFDARPPDPAERAFIEAEERYDETDGGYSAIMATRPDTVAAALVDSPAGLAAWLVDKYRDWSDCHGDLASRFDRDTLLTVITLYWVTEAIGSSFRQYLDYPRNPPRPDITVPVAVTLSAEPALAGFPRQLAERACPDLRRWTEPGVGGHFMPHEEPDLLADELRRFFLGALDER
ncbi:epoxide hydrolase family protein [Plantactinospora sp. BB1]|uniref:epoxide hydrolase family protein n=1 Tax=Plantactinospora sp. BB1 TaxID=2071627 RepID=UPI001F1FF6A5|nr:epoxide hydrolase family protein [Plantactinospora sp. BB1]